MPGVPSGRGCDACRKQKKRCDLIQPSCSRCTRLGIACIGCGQRRYKFVEEQSLALIPTSLIRATHQIPGTTVQCISWAPSNEMTMVTGAFCSALEVTDVRYDLSVYGEFLKEIPRRLGTNPALDASVSALTTAFASVHSRQQSLEAFASYVQALKALRVCLDDPKEVRSANTLCAIYLMVICQGWIGQRDDCISHGEALAHLLSTGASQGWQGSFEAGLVTTLCVPVIFESIGNPRIQLNPWLGKLTENHDKSIFIESLKLRNLAKLPEFIRYPEAHLVEINSAYQRMKTDVPEVRRQLSNIAQGAGPIRTLHARFQTVYSIVLAFAILLNAILRSIRPGNIPLVEESAILTDEIITLAEDASQYRPLGSSSMPLSLIAAWATTKETSKRVRVEEILTEYQADFSIARWMEIAFWLEATLSNHCPIQSALLESDLETSIDVACRTM